MLATSPTVAPRAPSATRRRGPPSAQRTQDGIEFALRHGVAINQQFLDDLTQLARCDFGQGAIEAWILEAGAAQGKRAM